MKLLKLISDQWGRQKITAKFSLVFGLLLALILLVDVSSYVMLIAVRNKTEMAIVTSTKIQQLVLKMDSHLEKARRLQRDFFLRYPQVGFSVARDTYAEEAIGQIDQVVKLSAELRPLIATSNVSQDLHDSNLDLNLYLSASERYRDTFLEAVALVTELADEKQGLQAQLAATSELLKTALEQTRIDNWMDLYYEMQLYEKDYLITRRRSSMQSVFNNITEIRKSVESAPTLDRAQKEKIAHSLDAYRATAEKVVDLDTAIRSKFNDFDLQAESIDPISKGFVALADAEVERARLDIERTSRLGTFALVATALGGLGLAILVGSLLNASITLNIVRLTKVAGELRAGNLDVLAPVNSGDEIGDLARTFNSMASQLKVFFVSLQANETRYRVLFEDSPISLWEEDFSLLKKRLDELRAAGISDWKAYFVEHPAEVRACAEMIRIVDVNRATYRMLKYEGNEALLTELPRVFAEDTYEVFRDELVALGEGKNAFETEIVHLALDGDEIYAKMKLNVVSGYEADWAKVLISLTDITERKRAEEALRENEQRYRALFECTNDAVFILNLEGVHLMVNQQAADLLGYAPEEIVGMSLQQVIAPGEYSGSLEKRDALLAGCSLPVYERVFRRKDGTHIQVEINAALVRDTNGQPLHIQSIVRDITDRKHTEREIRRLNDELERRVLERTSQLEAANKELEAFSYSVSHDLRAPLRAVVGFSRILQEDYAAILPPEASRLLDSLHAGAHQMGQLIDDLLKFSRLGRQSLRKQLIHPAELVRRALQTLSSEQEGRQVEILLTDLPPCQGDPGLLLEVWLNLLSNAYKYTRPCEVARIEVSWLTNESGETVYYVKDNGVGFNMQFANKLFGVFQRLHSSDEFEGTGVGLALAQRIILRHGGRIWAESQPGVGTTFSFTL